MQTATIQRRIETLPASRTVGVEAERRAVCIERCMHGSEGGAGASSSEAFRAYLRDRPRAPGGASAPSRARPALAGSPHTEHQDCSWPINRNRPDLDVLVF